MDENEKDKVECEECGELLDGRGWGHDATCHYYEIARRMINEKD